MVRHKQLSAWASLGKMFQKVHNINGCRFSLIGDYSILYQKNKWHRLFCYWIVKVIRLHLQTNKSYGSMEYTVTNI